MKRVVLGTVRFAAGRAFIPVIEEVAGVEGTVGGCIARPLSLVILEGEEITIHPFGRDLSLTDLFSMVPELEHTLAEARQSLSALKPHS
jgi:hypothetical protein